LIIERVVKKKEIFFFHDLPWNKGKKVWFFPTLEPYFIKKPVNLDITHRCPLQCGACNRQNKVYDKTLFSDMPISDLKKFIDDGFTHLEFCGQQSDPLTHPDILKFISLCHNIKLDIHTATSHKKKQFYEKAFHCSGLKTNWIFGLDGLPEESHLHRINQDGIYLFDMMKLGVSMGIKVMWQYIVFNYNQDHIDEAQKMAEEEGIEFILSFSSRWDTLAHLKPRDEYCAYS